MRVGVGLTNGAYTPEAYAYKEYLEGKGVSVELALRRDLHATNDINILFMGISPFWSSRSCKKEIHEYQSLSVPPLAKTKDFFKWAVNCKPAGRIFLNQTVKEDLGFGEAVPSITRDMGVDKAFYEIERNASPSYDLVYSGSIKGRVGLVDEICRLGLLGLKILVIGETDYETSARFKKLSHITLTGRVERQDLPALYRLARAGLNYTPDIYPFNIQTSTKTLEYCAAGLGLVSNQYKWAEVFCEEKDVSPLWVQHIKNRDDFDSYQFHKIDMPEYLWENILDRSGFLSFLEAVAG